MLVKIVYLVGVLIEILFFCDVYLVYEFKNICKIRKLLIKYFFKKQYDISCTQWNRVFIKISTNSFHKAS